MVNLKGIEQTITRWTRKRDLLCDPWKNSRNKVVYRDPYDLHWIALLWVIITTQNPTPIWSENIWLYRKICCDLPWSNVERELWREKWLWICDVRCTVAFEWRMEILQCTNFSSSSWSASYTLLPYSLWKNVYQTMHFFFQLLVLRILYLEFSLRCKNIWLFLKNFILKRVQSWHMGVDKIAIILWAVAREPTTSWWKENYPLRRDWMIAGLIYGFNND